MRATSFRPQVTTFTLALVALVVVVAAPVVSSALAQNVPATQPAAAPSSSAQLTATQPSTRVASTQGAPTPPLLCPVTHQPVERACVTLFRGKWVYFANAVAQGEFAADPLEYADGVQAQWAANPPLRVQVHCPVTRLPPSPGIYVGLGAAAVFFATEDAKQKWLADKRPYEEGLAACYTFQTGCGTCGGDIDPAVKCVSDGKTYYFCCNGCAGRFERDPAKYLERLQAQIAENERKFRQQPKTKP